MEITNNSSDESSKKKRREKYEQVKSEVKRLEESNFSKLILFRSGEEWYKMGGNSLLIYYYDIAKKILDLRPNIQPDTDYSRTIFDDGLLSFRGAEALQKKLEKAEVFKERKDSKDTVVFELNFSVTQEDIEKFKMDRQFEQDRAMSVIRPAVILHPRIYERIRHVQKRVFETVRKMSVFERDYNGMLMAEYSRKIVKYYMMINEGTVREGEGWKKIVELANMLVIEISFAVELREVRQDVAISIGAELIELRREAEKYGK